MIKRYIETNIIPRRLGEGFSQSSMEQLLWAAFPGAPFIYLYFTVRTQAHVKQMRIQPGKVPIAVPVRILIKDTVPCPAQ